MFKDIFKLNSGPAKPVIDRKAALTHNKNLKRNRERSAKMNAGKLTLDDIKNLEAAQARRDARAAKRAKV